MKAAVLHAYDESLSGHSFVKYEEVPDPQIERPTDVVVRIGGAGVCRTDLHIVEGIWRSKVDVKLPYIMGHENAGWVEAVGRAVESVKVGDAVICHPLVTSGHCLACRRGNDMQASESRFPGINTNGGYAEYLLTGERSLIKLPKTLAPKEVAPYTDAGLTAYRAAKKASRHLLPGEYAVVIGAGGLGHIGIQVLRALCAAEIIVIDRSETALALAKECGAHHTVKGDGNEVEAVIALTGGHGAEAVIDFVGEGDAVARGLAMTRNGGYLLHRRLRRKDRPADDRHDHQREDHRRQSRWHLSRAGRADGSGRPRHGDAGDARVPAFRGQPGVARSAPRQGQGTRRAGSVTRAWIAFPSRC